jgi:hypothetical protein
LLHSFAGFLSTLVVFFPSGVSAFPAGCRPAEVFSHLSGTAQILFYVFLVEWLRELRSGCRSSRLN